MAPSSEAAFASHREQAWIRRDPVSNTFRGTRKDDGGPPWAQVMARRAFLINSGKRMLHESNTDLGNLSSKHENLPCGRSDILTLFYRSQP